MNRAKTSKAIIFARLSVKKKRQKGIICNSWAGHQKDHFTASFPNFLSHDTRSYINQRFGRKRTIQYLFLRRRNSHLCHKIVTPTRRWHRRQRTSEELELRKVYDGFHALLANSFFGNGSKEIQIFEKETSLVHLAPSDRAMTANLACSGSDNNGDKVMHLSTCWESLHLDHRYSVLRKMAVF